LGMSKKNSRGEIESTGRETSSLKAGNAIPTPVIEIANEIRNHTLL
jgi:hypothetical protein